jgi:glyceraldehyde-3-phosphate dehydrogenase/erythrose-4-phosphate dehydrogenase
MYTAALNYPSEEVHGLRKHSTQYTEINKKLNEFCGLNNILNYNEEPSSSMPFMTTEHMTCFEMWVSSSLDTSVSLMSKLVRLL